MGTDRESISLVDLHHPPPGYPRNEAIHEDLRVKQSIRVWRTPGKGAPSITMDEVDLGTLDKQIRSYYETYYTVLQERAAHYPTRQEIFPDLLIDHRHITVTVSSDGIVAIHESANQTKLTLVHALDKTVKDITGDQYLQAPSGRGARFFQYDAGVDFGAYALWKPALIEGSTAVRPNWTRMDVASLGSLDLVFNEATAREYAKKDIQVSADAYLMGLDPEPPSKKQQDKVISELEAAINEFEKMLSGKPAEELIQEYLSIDRNRILLDPSAVSIKPKVKLGAEYEPDFVIEKSEEQYVLVELERPALPLLTEKGRPRSELTHAQQQVKDWFDWITRHSEYARSILPGISEPSGWVVMGRRNSIPAKYRHVLDRENAESRRIETSTYDDLLNRARQHLINLRKL